MMAKTTPSLPNSPNSVRVSRAAGRVRQGPTGINRPPDGPETRRKPTPRHARQGFRGSPAPKSPHAQEILYAEKKKGVWHDAPPPNHSAGNPERICSLMRARNPARPDHPDGATESPAISAGLLRPLSRQGYLFI